MLITDDDICRFQGIWHEEFEEAISADEARAHIARLDVLYLLLARRPTRESDQAPSRSEAIQNE